LYKILLIAPCFAGQSFWSLDAACEIYGARTITPPLGLITVAAMLPSSWECRLVDRNAEDLLNSDLAWADLVMTGGMLPQRPCGLCNIANAPARAPREALAHTRGDITRIAESPLTRPSPKRRPAQQCDRKFREAVLAQSGHVIAAEDIAAVVRSGSLADIGGCKRTSAVTLKSGHEVDIPRCPHRANRGLMHYSKCVLFDHLVGAGDNRLGDDKTERLGGF
jgi:hypothetical protein